jgi:glycosyltransferase involved in cell wall biosynthesis
MVAVTVIVPTTGDRGPLLAYSVGSALRQTVVDVEVFIVGDGVDDDTRRAAHELSCGDARVRFVDRPKDARRGEVFRHELLTTVARGEVVAYLCDRDLWFSDHLATVTRMLTSADLASTISYGFPDPGAAFTFPPHDSFEVVARMSPSLRARQPGPLSHVAHTMSAYRRLPAGWRQTPPDHPTDSYMWAQFLELPDVRCATSAWPTVVYLRRGAHPGLPTDRRRDLMEHWTRRMTAPDGEQEIRDEVVTSLWREWKHVDSRSTRARLRRRVGVPFVEHVRRPAGRLARRVGLRR